MALPSSGELSTIKPGEDLMHEAEPQPPTLIEGLGGVEGPKDGL